MADKTKQTDAEAEEAALDAFMADAFGTNVDTEAHPGATTDDLDTIMAEEPDEDAPDEDEADEVEGEDEDTDADEDDDDSDEEYEDEDEGDEEDDDTDEDDESEEGDDDGESEDDEANIDEGDGADETLSDGQMALDMQVDATLRSYVAPSDDFDPSVVGTEAEYIEDAKEVFGSDFDDDYVEKMGKANFKSAMRRAEKRHAAGTQDRVEARRDADTVNLTNQSAALKAKYGQEAVAKVAARMARIYQQKIDATSHDAANQIPVEAYYRLAGGAVTVPKQKGKSKSGVASRQAKVQKRKAVQAQLGTDQVGKARRPGKRKVKKDRAMAELEAHLTSQSKLDAMLFGD